jgi:methionine-S-sulfoxide reductase
MQEEAILGGGCFWCVEAVMESLNGVSKVESGYINGQVLNPNYKQVCTGATGHAEVVRVQFDPTIISFEQILEVFFATHDPTTLNRQGADVGTQYRSGVYITNASQEQTAKSLIARLNEEKVFERPIVTEVVPAATFYKAEDYHQGYYRQNGYAGYCQVVISPKVAKLRQKFPTLAKKAD